MRSALDSNPLAGEPQGGGAGRASVITVTGTGFRGPDLRFTGEWLAAAGFGVGTWAEVHAGSGRIVIEARGHLADPGAVEERRERRKALRA